MENYSELALAASLTPEEKLHVEIMSAIVRDVSDTPLVLKGGTALLLAYGLDRFSEDLDFDSNKAINLQNKLKSVVSKYAEIKAIDVKKNTDTVLRYRVAYKSKKLDKENFLKIEISFRSNPSSSDITVINGMRVYKIQALIDQKLNALENRTRARDLYDVTFLTNKYLDKFNDSQLEKLRNFTQNLDTVEKRFLPAFQEDLILANSDVPKLIISLHEAIAPSNTKNIHIENNNHNTLSEAAKKALTEYMQSLYNYEQMAEQAVKNFDTPDEDKHVAIMAREAKADYQQKAQEIITNKTIYEELQKNAKFSLSDFNDIGGLKAVIDRLKSDQTTTEDIGLINSHIKQTTNELCNSQNLGKGRGR